MKLRDGTEYETGTYWRKLPVGTPAWAVVDSGGEVVDLYTHEVKREHLMLHDDERIVEGVFTISEKVATK